MHNHLADAHAIFKNSAKFDGTGARQQSIKTMISLANTDVYPYGSKKHKEFVYELMRMLVSDALPLSLVTSKAFRRYSFIIRAMSIEKYIYGRFMAFVNPKFQTVSRAAVKTALLFEHQLYKTTLRDGFLDISAFSMTTDSWSSIISDNYFAVTVTYISEAWTLETRVIDMKPMDSSHTFAHIRAYITEVLDYYGILNKTFFATTDGANKGVFVSGSGDPLIGVCQWGWCRPHKMHLLVTKSIEEAAQVTAVITTAQSRAKHVRLSPRQVRSNSSTNTADN